MPITKENGPGLRKKAREAALKTAAKVRKIQDESESVIVADEKDEGLIRQDAKAEFLRMQRRVLAILKLKTRSTKLNLMDPKELADLLKVCRDNIHAIRAAEMTEAEHTDHKIEFVTSVPMDKKSGGGTVQ